jgi:hypothetical protein
MQIAKWVRERLGGDDAAEEKDEPPAEPIPDEGDEHADDDDPSVYPLW